MSEPRKAFGRGRWKAVIVLEALLNGVELESEGFLGGRTTRIHPDGHFQVKVWKARLGDKQVEPGDPDYEYMGEAWIGLEMSISAFVRECHALPDQQLVALISAAALQEKTKRG